MDKWENEKETTFFYTRRGKFIYFHSFIDALYPLVRSHGAFPHAFFSDNQKRGWVGGWVGAGWWVWGGVVVGGLADVDVLPLTRLFPVAFLRNQYVFRMIKRQH